MTLTQRVVGSSALLVSIKLVHRALGLVSTLILARLLTPADFGLVALVSITVYFFDVLSSAGSDQYIIRKAEVSRDDLDSAWTLDLAMKLGLWLLLQLSAAGIGRFFGQEGLEQALRVGSLVLPINALASARLNLLKQDFLYRGIFWLSVTQRLATFLLVLGLAYEFRSYWALIAGDLFSSALFTAGSYAIASHRPRLTWVRVGEQWQFSAWMLVKSVTGYIRAQVDTLFVSRLFPADTLGSYHMARELAMLPAHNLVVPASEPLLALFRTSRSSPEATRKQLRWSLTLNSLLTIPVAGFLLCFSDSLVAVLLGRQWGAAAPILASMSLLLAYFSYTVIYERLLVAAGKVRLLFTFDVLSLFVVTGVLLLAIDRTAGSIALARGGAGCVNLLLIALVSERVTGTRGAFPALASAICVLATAGSATAASLAAPTHASTLVSLLAQGAVFSLCYLASAGIALYLGCRDIRQLLRSEAVRGRLLSGLPRFRRRRARPPHPSSD